MNNSPAIHYDQFFGPLFFEAYALEVENQIDSIQVSTVLEIAAGTGRVTRHIRERIPKSAKLIASDISEDMLSVAKEKLGHLDIVWRNIDVQRLPFDDDSVELVICCFDYMFVPDRPKPFAEVYRILKPGGLLLFTTWDELKNNAASYISRRIAQEYVEEPVPKSYNLATSMSDVAAIEALLENAGFAKPIIEKVGLFSVSSTAKEATMGLVERSPLYENIKRRNPGLIDEIKVRLEKELTEKLVLPPWSPR